MRDLRQRAVALIEQRAGVGEPVVRLAVGAQDPIERHLRVERRDADDCRNQLRKDQLVDVME